MRNSKAFKRCFIIAAILVLVCTGVFGAINDSLPSKGEHYLTYADYQAAGYSAPTWRSKAAVITQNVLEYARELYASGELKEAYKWVNNGGYFGWYETTGFERNTMGYISGARVSAVELQFKTTRQSIKKDLGADTVNANLDTLIAMLTEDGKILGERFGDADAGEGTSSAATNSANTSASGSTSAAVTTFVACYSILLREGFEAILIVGAILAYLRKSSGEDKIEAARKCRPVYLGSLIGIVGSLLLAWLLYAIKLANTASQEVIEGITALTAVVVLYYVSNWMLSKSETDAWVGYIRSRAEKNGGKGRAGYYALAFTAFLAVFREGAEVVLFYQPLLSQGYPGSVWAGMIFGAISLVVVYLLIKYLSVKIPIRPFFTATSILMFLMSVSFLGAGIKELIEGDVLSATTPNWLSWIPYTDFLDVLGIYPILETLIPQLLLLAVSVVIFVIQTKKNNAIHALAENKRLEEEAVAEAKAKAAEEEAFKARVKAAVLEVLKDMKQIPGKDSADK